MVHPRGEAEIVAAQCLHGRIQPSDVAALAMFLAASDARLCTGRNYRIDAGWRQAGRPPIRAHGVAAR